MKPDENSVNEAKALIASVLDGEGTVSDTTQTPEKTDVFTPTADPNAGTSVPETPAESVIIEEPAESIPEETPTETPAEQPTEPSEPNASTETPTEPETPAETPAETPSESSSISLPSQEELEQAASSIQQAASTILDALFNAASSSTNEAA